MTALRYAQISFCVIRERKWGFQNRNIRTLFFTRRLSFPLELKYVSTSDGIQFIFFLSGVIREPKLKFEFLIQNIIFSPFTFIVRMDGLVLVDGRGSKCTSDNPHFKCVNK